MLAIDKWGFTRQQEYNGSDRTGRYSYCKNTNNETIRMWVKPNVVESGKTVYVVSKSTYDENKPFHYQYTNKVITQFTTAIKAKEWINKEYSHMF